MEQKGPSRSAIGTAVHRAAHLLLDEDPKIIIDPFVRAFAGYASDAEMLQALASLEMIAFPRMWAVFTVRSRFAEDELAGAGLSQRLGGWVRTRYDRPGGRRLRFVGSRRSLQGTCAV
jgi:hypothetical protein